MYRLLLTLFSAIFLLGAIGLGFTVIKKQQDIRGKAQETELAPSSLVNYKSDKYNYSISFNKEYWIDKSGILERDKDQNPILFELNRRAGMASIMLEVKDSDSFLEDNEVKIVKKEKMTRLGLDLQKLTLEELVINRKIQFYRYIFQKGKNYYGITAKYLPGPSKDLAERFIDSFISQNFSNIKGESDKNKSELSESQVAALTSPSIVNILSVDCYNLKTNIPPVNEASVSAQPILYLKPNYSFCAGAKGTGFMISEKGHIATNGHVVKMNPQDTILPTMVTGVSKDLTQFFIDLFRQEYVRGYGKEISEQKVREFIPDDLILDDILWASKTIDFYFKSKALDIETESSKYFIQLGETPFSLGDLKDLDKALKGIKLTNNIREARLIDVNYSEKSSDNESAPSGPDVAVLKILNSDNLNYPGFNINKEVEVNVGNELLIFGYPGLVQGSDDNKSLLSFKSSGKPTLTKGIVSSIKEDQTGNKLIQTDASIEAGNSGGPVFNQNADIIGMATYAVSSLSGQYNFFRSISETKDVMKRNRIEVAESPVYYEWNQGLLYYWDGYYRKALKHFKKVKQLYSIHPTVDEYITKTQSKIEEGEDKEGVIGLITDIISLQIITIGSGILMIIGALGMIVVFANKRRLLYGPPVSTTSTA